MSRRGIDIHLEWIPSHCGVHGNEVVDSLAKEDALLYLTEIRIPTSKKEAVSHLKHHQVEKWQSEWETSDTGRHLFHIQPKVKESVKLYNLNRREEKIVHRLRLGKCNLNHYKHTINKHNTGLCEICQDPETVEHVLLQCKKFTKERKKMLLQLKRKTITVEELLRNNNYFSALIHFIKAIGYYDSL